MPLSALQKSSAISHHRNFLIQFELLQNTKQELRPEPEYESNVLETHLDTPRDTMPRGTRTIGR